MSTAAGSAEPVNTVIGPGILDSRGGGFFVGRGRILNFRLLHPPRSFSYTMEPDRTGGKLRRAREFLKSRDNRRLSAHVSVLSALSRWKLKCRKQPPSQVENPLYELLTYDY